jgi:hypothetical protein
MVQRYVFGDEAGTLQFNPKASRYFILTTVTLPDCTVGDALLGLRRDLAWEGIPTHPEFHATEEQQPVRDRVFAVLDPLDFRIDATIFEKSKALPKNRRTEAYFYQFAWFYHLKFLCEYRLKQADLQLLVVAATIGGKRQVAFSNAVANVVGQVAQVSDARCAFWMGRSDPCLWLADYCSWAIQRKWEHAGQDHPDTRSYDLIKAKIGSEYDLFAPGTNFYY